MARFNSPEVHSDAFNFKLALGTDTANSISLDRAEKADDDIALRVSAAMSLGNGFEARYVSNGEDKLSVKYQWLGAPLEQKLPGNVSLATSLGFIHSDRRESASHDSNNWQLKQQAVDLSLIAGYRLSDTILTYGSVFYQNGKIDGTYYLTERYDADVGDYIDHGCDIERRCVSSHFSDNGDAFGVSLTMEYEISRWLVVSGEVVYHQANWFNRNNSETGANVNLEFVF